MTFEQWYEKVNIEFIAYTGLDRDSWADGLYWDMWNDGLTPLEAVATVINDEYGVEAIEAFGLEHVEVY